MAVTYIYLIYKIYILYTYNQGSVNHTPVLTDKSRPCSGVICMQDSFQQVLGAAAAKAETQLTISNFEATNAKQATKSTNSQP